MDNQKKSINTRDIKEDTLRDWIKAAQESELVFLMSKEGWGYSADLSSYEKTAHMVIRFDRYEWLGVPLGVKLSYGFMTPDLNTLSRDEARQAILLATRKSAELTMLVSEVFNDRLPRSAVSPNGLLEEESPDFQRSFQSSRSEFADELRNLQREKDRRDRVFEDPDNASCLKTDIETKNDFHHLKVQGKEILLSAEDIERLEGWVENFKQRRKTKMAI